MKALITSLSLVVGLIAGPAFAADEAKKDPSPAQQAQQERMRNCNKEAGEKSLGGDERKQFMKDCLAGKTASQKPEAAPPATPQEKMKVCNKDASEKELKGDERKKFMSECLKR
ncbi:PsiF family protein [Rhodocyclus purpureus]|uniref:PsiF family protein n=1 Tax=Rhodocyclus purpureus TaxID=1067 RepID=UPI0019127721|nr:PsiF family protein [Rhodocyclus purpureus]MBK5914040.1 phosphate-starvation-inducible protein PsiF [Rhodocyclus purpureus]